MVAFGEGLQLIARQVNAVIPLEGDSGCFHGHTHFQIVRKNVEFLELDIPLDADRQLEGQVENLNEERPIFQLFVDPQEEIVNQDKNRIINQFIEGIKPQQELDCYTEVVGLAQNGVETLDEKLSA